MICSGSGSAWLASCLAGAHSTAGINYGRNGVCYQMANRILRPAAIDVSRARGYDFTKLLYGKYGTDASADGSWAELDHCLKLQAEPELHEEGTPFLSGVTPPGGGPTSMPGRIDEMLDERLGVDYAPVDRARLRELAAAAEHEQNGLESAFQSQRITPDQYLERFTRLAADLFASYERVLGRDDFVRLFGAPPEHALDFLDPELFRQAHGSRN